MTNDQLTTILVTRILGWDAKPDRYMTGNRGWIPRWRFQPTKKLEDAYRLLEAATAECSISNCRRAGWSVSVKIGASVGNAEHVSAAWAITFAIARAIGLDVAASE